MSKLTLPIETEAGAGRRRVAVVDIGSNSVRLVVFDAYDRTLRTLFNEKVLCGLGRGLSATGRLNPNFFLCDCVRH